MAVTGSICRVCGFVGYAKRSMRGSFWMAIAFLAILAAPMARAQETAAIRGHVLGESIADFIGRTPGGQQRLDGCRNAPPRTAPPSAVPTKEERKEAKRLKRIDILGNLGNPAHLQTAREMEGEERAAASLALCRSLLDAVDRGARAEVPLSLEAGSGTPEEVAILDGGKLVGLKLMLGIYRVGDPKWEPAYFEDVRLDMVTKLGKPTSEDDLVTQNGFGAVFHHRVATWDIPSLHAEVREVDPNLNEPITNVSVQTRAEHERELKAAAPRRSALD